MRWLVSHRDTDGHGQETGPSHASYYLTEYWLLVCRTTRVVR
jgi:hypothetical protein